MRISRSLLALHRAQLVTSLSREAKRASSLRSMTDLLFVSSREGNNRIVQSILLQVTATRTGRLFHSLFRHPRLSGSCHRNRYHKAAKGSVREQCRGRISRGDPWQEVDASSGLTYSRDVWVDQKQALDSHDVTQSSFTRTE
jgi:hypothetical protein